jgi:hypothetical protein
MKYTLWTNGRSLGYASPELPQPTATSFSGFFYPSDAFASVGVALLALSEAVPGLARDMGPALEAAAAADVPPEERGRGIQEALRSDPAARRLSELHLAVKALALELRDEAGVLMPARDISIGRLPLQVPLDAAREDAAAMGHAFSEFVVAVIQ